MNKTPTMPAELAQIIALHREMFHDWTMQADTDSADTSDAHPEARKAETDWKAEARKWEDRSKANKAEADANRAAAEELARLKEAQKSDAEKAADARASAERERDQAKAELKAARLESAIARHAGNADPARLLDSVKFRASVDRLDPGDEKAIKAAITEFVRANPWASRVQVTSGDTAAGFTNPVTGKGLEGTDLLAAALKRNRKQ